MDQNPSDFGMQKDKLAKELLDIMVRALEEDRLSVEDSSKISSFIVDRFDQAQDIYYLKASIEQLASKWSVFQPILLSFQDMSAVNQDQIKIEETQKLLEELKSQNN